MKRGRTRPGVHDHDHPFLPGDVGGVHAAGALAWLRKKKTPSDYLIASRDIPPWLTALSAISTNNSGFMFIGMIAFTYAVARRPRWQSGMWEFV
jgi:hypothetical protein